MLDAQPAAVYSASPDDPSRKSKFEFWLEHHRIYFLTIVLSTNVAVGMKFDPTCRQRNLSSTTALDLTQFGSLQGLQKKLVLFKNKNSKKVSILGDDLKVKAVGSQTLFHKEVLAITVLDTGNNPIDDIKDHISDLCFHYTLDELSVKW